ncbi:MULTISPECIES: NAD(P)/FAD-dependent oxidoreductase [Hyphobacterium]|uniref:NAD(P)/FAD-dependent oxidoreductase n=1 Tax=Hyphobacterium vulgare TaxID=1736751 RepID=A0ABV6ZU64_9PROT
MDSKRFSTPRVAIIGGGAIGLASAWALARAGASVTVLEVGPEAGQGALAASGGMLAQGFEGANEDAGRAFVALAARSLSLWDDWAERLIPHAASPLGYRRSGSLSPGFGARGEAWLDRLAANAALYEIPFERLDAASAREIQSGLGKGLTGGIRFPGDGEVDNRALGPALVNAIRAAGGAIRTDWPVTRIESHAGGVAVSGPAGQVEVDRVVLAAGWQSLTLSAFVPEARFLVPVKGQMLSVEPVAGLTGCIRAADAYLSAKPGRIVIGATSEVGASDDAIQPELTPILREAAETVLPALEHAKTAAVWTGVRPGTSDGLPILGQSACAGVVLALGAYRNGVLLAPAMAEVVRHLVMGGSEADPAFAPDRPLGALTRG